MTVAIRPVNTCRIFRPYILGIIALILQLWPPFLITTFQTHDAVLESVMRVLPCNQVSLLAWSPVELACTDFEFWKSMINPRGSSSPGIYSHWGLSSSEFIIPKYQPLWKQDTAEIQCSGQKTIVTDVSRSSRCSVPSHTVIELCKTKDSSSFRKKRQIQYV